MPADASRPLRTSVSWAPASTSPCRTSTSAAPATCWVPSSRDLSATWATRPTRRFSTRPWPSLRVRRASLKVKKEKWKVNNLLPQPFTLHSMSPTAPSRATSRCTSPTNTCPATQSACCSIASSTTHATTASWRPTARGSSTASALCRRKPRSCSTSSPYAVWASSWAARRSCSSKAA